MIKAESEQRIVLFLLQSMKCASMCFTNDLFLISELIKLDQPSQLNGQIKTHFRRCVLSILGRAQSVIDANGGFIED